MIENKKLLIGAGVAALVIAAGYLGFRAYRGPVGGTEAKIVADFTSLEPARWKNGEPKSLAASRGEVLLVEGWSPT
jgi:hypothetical protein